MTVLCFDSLPETLAALLRKRQVEALLSDAEIIRSWSDEKERHVRERRTQAKLLIRDAMYRRTIGRISQEEASQVFSILSFAMPADYTVESE